MVHYEFWDKKLYNLTFWDNKMIILKFFGMVDFFRRKLFITRLFLVYKAKGTKG